VEAHSTPGWTAEIPLRSDVPAGGRAGHSAHETQQHHLFALGQEAVAGQALSVDQLTGLAGSIPALGLAALLVWRRGGARRLAAA
jgi:hypothetical protein